MIKTLIAVAVAGAFALPVAALASAQGDNIVLAQSGGGGDTGSSVRQPGANPPGSASPGAPRDTTTSTDRDTGAASRTNPNGGMSGAGASSMRERFDRLDRNRDGFISRDEARDANELNTRFSELDRNNDGKLTPEEYSAIDSGVRGARGSAGATTSGTGSVSGSASAPGKGVGAQDSASQPLGGGGSDGASGGGTK